MNLKAHMLCFHEYIKGRTLVSEVTKSSGFYTVGGNADHVLLGTGTGAADHTHLAMVRVT